MNRGMVLSALALVLGAYAGLPALASEGRVASLSASEARSTEGAVTDPIGPVPKKIKCLPGYAQHDCNAENNITNCSGAGAACTACVPPAGSTTVIWSCKPITEEWDCTPLSGQGDPNVVNCGTKVSGACRYIGTYPNGDWFCVGGADTTAQCTKEIEDKCM